MYYCGIEILLKLNCVWDTFDDITFTSGCWHRLRLLHGATEAEPTTNTYSYKASSSVSTAAMVTQPAPVISCLGHGFRSNQPSKYIGANAHPALSSSMMRTENNSVGHKITYGNIAGDGGAGCVMNSTNEPCAYSSLSELFTALIPEQLDAPFGPSTAGYGRQCWSDTGSCVPQRFAHSCVDSTSQLTRYVGWCRPICLCLRVIVRSRRV